MARLSVVSVLTALIALSGTSATVAQEFPPPGKTIMMQIGFNPGGGTDAAGLLIAKYLKKYLPNEPGIQLQHMPGAGGMTALNHVVLKTPPDGMLLIMGGASALDPLNTRKANAKYDPTKFRIVGGIGRGGSALVITADGEKKLLDKSGPPAIMGSSGPIPRQGMQAVLWGAEYLGWNVKWVTGYPGTNELMLALDREEIDMTTTGNIFALQDRIKAGKLKIINQSGMIKDGKSIGRADFSNAPLLTERMEGKIKDPVAQKSFDYWLAMNTADKWLALHPETPDRLVNIYRAAFDKMAVDKGFLDEGERISDGFFPVGHNEVERYIKTLADTPDEAVNFTTQLMQKQGIQAK
jgi:tripartite-type tricarboxylate transporter receptor subunit TctC